MGNYEHLCSSSFRSFGFANARKTYLLSGRILPSLKLSMKTHNIVISTAGIFCLPVYHAALGILTFVTRTRLRGCLLFLLMVILALSGCATPSSSSSPTRPGLEKGMTMSQVRAIYGEPTRSTITSDGTSWLYTTAQPANPLSAFFRPKLMMVNFGANGRILYFSNSGY